jgi:hypothetical protein
LKFFRAKLTFCRVSPFLGGGLAMTLRFLPTRLRFNRMTRGVHVMAEHEGDQVEIVICRAAVEWLRGARGLGQDESFTTVVKHKARLEHAAEIAVSRHGDDCLAIDLELTDLHLAGYPKLDAEMKAARDIQR